MRRPDDGTHDRAESARRLLGTATTMRPVASHHVGSAISPTAPSERGGAPALSRYLVTVSHRVGASRQPGWASEPIALIGLSCRLPGGLASPEDLWDQLCDRRQTISDGSGDRPRNAPFAVRRLVLELVSDALDDAGSDPSGRSVRLFLGSIWSDHSVRVDRQLVDAKVDVDTTSASSAIAIDLACRSLGRGDAAMALAGGLRADGGGAVLVLKRLTSAISDGDRILFLIGSSAIESGTSSTTAPPPSTGFGPSTLVWDLREAGATPFEGSPFACSRIAVSSMDTSGTGRHLLIEAAQENRALILPFSADDIDELRRRATVILDAATQVRTWDEAAALCRSAASRHRQAKYRIAIAADDRGELVSRLSELLSRDTLDVQPALPRPRLTFVCPDHRWPSRSTARSLLLEEEVFRAEIEACHWAVRSISGCSLIDALLADDARARGDRTEIADLVSFSVEIALGALLRAWGIEPDAVVGSGAGEVAACYLAGALSLRDAVRILSARPQLAPGVLTAYRKALHGIAPRTATIPLRSSVRNAWLQGPECGPDYWIEALTDPPPARQPIGLFGGTEPRLFLELDTDLSSVAVDGERRSRFELLAALFGLGFEPHWRAVLGALDSHPLRPELVAAMDHVLGEPTRRSITRRNGPGRRSVAARSRRARRPTAMDPGIACSLTLALCS